MTQPESSDIKTVREALEQFERLHLLLDNPAKRGLEALIRLSAKQAGRPSYDDLMRAIYIYQERCGQSLEDTLAGKWTNPPAPRQAAFEAIIPEKLEYAQMLAHEYLLCNDDLLSDDAKKLKYSIAHSILALAETEGK